jgi:dihydropteroate synthase
MSRARDVRLRIGDETVEFCGRPMIMGIVNVTPDSFSDGGRFLAADQAVAHAEALVADGADWLDVGGESTRPGATPVSLDEELRRVMPVLERLAGRVHTPISIDTYKPTVARRAVETGARIINDVTGFRDPAMIEVAVECRTACVCMHMRGTPQTMQQFTHYDDVVGEIVQYFTDRLDHIERNGVERERILIDPGIGFAKKRRQNLEILKRLDALHGLGRPILLGTSRKRFIGELTGRTELDRLPGTIATSVYAVMQGVQVLRVHDVAAVRDAIDVVCAILNPEIT